MISIKIKRKSSKKWLIIRNLFRFIFISKPNKVWTEQQLLEKRIKRI
jgi:hypothetical protein